jgi:AraC family transcriptional regulator
MVSRGTQDAVSYARSGPEAAQRMFLTLEPRVFQRAVPEAESGEDLELIDQWGIEDRQIEYILRTLDADLEAGLPAGGLFGESLLNSLAVYLQRRYGVKPIADVKPRNGLPKIRLNRVIEFIEEHLDQDITLAALAETVGMGPHYFSELFKQSLGISPHQYVLRRRIERGRKLLHNPSVSVLEAAVRSGFSDQSHFTKLFRRIVGVTPSKYRSIL